MKNFSHEAFCAKCNRIQAVEGALKERAQTLTKRVLSHRQPIRQRNNQRWQIFAWWCALPFIGRLIFRLLNHPKRLESYHSCRDEPWFKDESTSIHRTAKNLEALKKAHLEHWGHERVQPADDTDLAGRYTSQWLTRTECYERKLEPFIPNEFDFNTMAGFEKFEEGELVLCARTFQLVAVKNCIAEFCHKTGERFYWARQ